MAARPKLTISEQRIRGKLLECEFFLERMGRSRNPEEFGYYLSAFLAALATFTKLGLIRKYGRHAARALEQLRKASPELDFLLEARDVEVHRDGVRIWLYRASQLWSRFTRFDPGLRPRLALTQRRQGPWTAYRYRSGFGGSPVPVNLTLGAKVAEAGPGYGATFGDPGRDVLMSCANALHSVRSLAD
jgi:hypothetical protein